MNYEYIDTHSHLHFLQFDEDREDVIARMREQKVATIAVGVGIDTSAGAVALAKQYPDVVLGATIGVHPNDTDEEFVAESYEPLLEGGVVVGVGECGLDYFRSDPLETYERQKRVFAAQIEFAAAHGLPLMLHVRPSKGSDDAHEDALAMLEEAKAKHGDKVRGNAHFFTGSLAMAKRYWSLGFTTAFPGVITFAKETEEVVRACPPDMMLSETDAPYAAPVPHRGERCEPVHVIETVKTIAAIRGESLEEVRQRLRENAGRVFGIGAH